MIQVGNKSFIPILFTYITHAFKHKETLQAISTINIQFFVKAIVQRLTDIYKLQIVRLYNIFPYI